MNNRISKVEIAGDYGVRCTFYSGDVKEYNVAHLEECPKKNFGDFKIANNGNCIKWKDGFELLAEDIWGEGIIVDSHFPEPKYQLAILMSYYREINKYTQKSIEEATGISQSDVSKYERGEGNASLDTINRVASAFGRKVRLDFVSVTKTFDIDINEFKGAEEIFNYLPSWKRQGLFTVEDVQNIPSKYKLELVNGVIRLMGQPSVQHQDIAMNISGTLWNFIKKNRGKCKVLQTTALILEDDSITNTYLVPDITVVCNRDNIGKNGIINYADFIVEIVSPGNKNRDHDYKTKLSIYMRAGIREYWIVDPEKQKVTVFAENNNYMPSIYGFDSEVPVAIYGGELKIDMHEMIEEG